MWTIHVLPSKGESGLNQSFLFERAARFGERKEEKELANEGWRCGCSLPAVWASMAAAVVVSPLGYHGRCQRLVLQNRALPIERCPGTGVFLPSLVAAGPWSPGAVRWLLLHVRVSGGYVEDCSGKRRPSHEPLDVVDPDDAGLHGGPVAGRRGGFVQRVRAASSSLLLDAVVAAFGGR